MAQISASMKDINIDQVQAKAWINEAEEEIAEVKAILKKSSNALANYPEKDTMLEQFADVCMKLGETWDDACVKLKEAADNIQNTVESIGKVIGDSIDDVFSFVKKISK